MRVRNCFTCLCAVFAVTLLYLRVQTVQLPPSFALGTHHREEEEEEETAAISSWAPPPDAMPVHRPFSATADEVPLRALREFELHRTVPTEFNLWRMTLHDRTSGQQIEAMFRFFRQQDDGDLNKGGVRHAEPFSPWSTDAAHDVAAFHVDRLLGFFRTPPTVGRCFRVPELARSCSDDLAAAQDGSMVDHAPCTFDWSRGKVDASGAPAGIAEPPGTRGWACGSLQLLVPRLGAFCPAINKALCHTRAKCAATGTPAAADVPPTARVELAELGLFDFLVQNIDRKVCTFKMQHGLQEGHSADHAMKDELETEADGLFVINLHCIGARGGGQPPPLGMGASAGAGAGAGAERHREAGGVTAFIDNGSWMHAGMTESFKAREGLSFWEGFFHGNCRVGADVAAALMRVAADFELRFEARAARGGAEKVFTPGLTPAVLHAIGKRVRGVRAHVRKCVPDESRWRRSLADFHRWALKVRLNCLSVGGE